jgi:ubiquinone/menaquinone biosynthesis C-methylase UbiE
MLISTIGFNLMSFGFKIRNFFNPPANILEEAKIKPGFYILDYGCGPGSYSIAASELLGKLGKVYALDIHPLAIKKVKDIASKRQLENIETIHSNCKTSLPESSIDTILLYDVFHELSNPNAVLEELYRILRSGGILSFSDHHMKEHEFLTKITANDFFKPLKKNKHTYSFVKKNCVII